MSSAEHVFDDVWLGECNRTRTQHNAPPCPAHLVRRPLGCRQICATLPIDVSGSAIAASISSEFSLNALRQFFKKELKPTIIDTTN